MKNEWVTYPTVQEIKLSWRLLECHQSDRVTKIWIKIRPEVIKLFRAQQLSMEFQIVIKSKILKNIDFLLSDAQMLYLSCS